MPEPTTAFLALLAGLATVASWRRRSWSWSRFLEAPESADCLVGRLGTLYIRQAESAMETRLLRCE